jgi:transcriptional regulator with XRE-family HTH domain
MSASRRRSPKVEVWMLVKDGSRLRRRRRDKHLSQVQLAALTGYTQQYISALERGTDTDCSEKVAEKISRYLDVDLEDYFEERRIIRNPSDATPSRGSSAA